MWKKEVRVSWRYPYPVETVFQAIAAGQLLMTCGGRMHEFQHDFRVGGKYAFSWAPGEICTGTYLEIVPHEKLKWTWNENSKSEPKSEVTVYLKQKGAFTVLDLVHEKVTSMDSAHSYHQGWTEVLGLFLDELTGTTIRLHQDFDVSVEGLFQALAQGALFRCVTESDKDFQAGRIDFREGGSYDYPIGQQDYARGQFTKIVPNEQIRFTWSTLDSGMAVEETEVLLFLEKRDENKTRLHLVQDGLPNSTVSKSHIRGWSEALGQLSHQWK